MPSSPETVSSIVRTYEANLKASIAEVREMGKRCDEALYHFFLVVFCGVLMTSIVAVVFQSIVAMAVGTWVLAAVTVAMRKRTERFHDAYMSKFKLIEQDYQAYESLFLNKQNLENLRVQ